MLRENLRDAGQIIQNILTQPVMVPEISDETTLLAAAQNYHEGEGTNSPLSKVMLSFLRYPEPTQILIQELEILHKELNA